MAQWRVCLRRLIISLGFTLLAAPAFASCPSIATDCPSGTANNWTVGNALTAGSATVSGALTAGSASVSGTASVTGGSTLTGGATIGGSSFSGVSITLNGSQNGVRWERVQTAGVNRFQWGPVGSETGSNLGSDLEFQGFSDTGSNLNNSFILTRANGGISQTSTSTLSSNTSNNAASSGFLLNQTFNGTSNVANGAVLNAINMTDNLNFTGANNGIQGLNVQINYGTGIGGGRTALNAVSNQTAGPTGGTDAAFNGVGASFDARANFNVGGTSPTIGSAKGFVFGSNPSAHLLGTATNFISPIGEEVDLVTGSGSSFIRKVGVQIVSLSNDVQHGNAGVDADLLFFANGGSQMDYGLLLGDEQGYGPVSSTGTMIGSRIWGGTSQAVGTVGWGIDFLSTIAANGLIRGNGFQVDGSGNTYVGFGILKPDSGGLVIDTNISQATTATVNTGGSGWTGAADVNDNMGNIWTIAVNGGGAVTSATLKRAAQNSTAPATTTIQPQWFQPAATGTVLNVSYSTGTTLKLNPSGNTLIGTGSPLATGATSGFPLIPSSAGTPTGSVSGAGTGKVAIEIDTTNKKLCYSTGGGTWECSAAFSP